MKKYVCIKDCYYLDTLFKVGDSLPAGQEPNKHFMNLDGDAPIPQEKTVLTAGDDPRATLKIIEDVAAMGCKIDEGTSRKEAFALWVKLYKKQGAEPNEKKQPEKKTTEPPEPPKEVTPFNALTPDELDALKPKQLGEMYGVPYHGKSKENLIKEISEKFPRE